MPTMPAPMWRKRDLEPYYDVVIVGGGAHGLATAYYLTQQGIKSVALLEAESAHHSGSGCDTGILQCNYRTEAGIRFCEESLQLVEALAEELDFNLMFRQPGHITLGHSESAIRMLTAQAESNKALGVDSRMMPPDEIKAMLPEIDISTHPRYPIMGALYHPSGGVICRDAMIWAYARGAYRGGAHIHNFTTVTDIVVRAGRIEGVRTNRGDIACAAVVSAVAGWSSEVCGQAGIALPVAIYPRQALVTEAYKPWLHHVVASADLRIHLSQSERGELVCGGQLDSYPHRLMRSTIEFMETVAAAMLDLFPILHNVKVRRQWAHPCELTLDHAPVISAVDEVRGLFINCGWGTHGAEAVAASGLHTATMVVSGKPTDLIEPFSLARFRDLR